MMPRNACLERKRRLPRKNNLRKVIEWQTLKNA
jgi:hypothetical protein